MLEQVPDRIRNQWHKKCQFIKTEETFSDAEKYQAKSAIFAEFGKVIVIAAGFFYKNDEKVSLRIKSFHAHEEKEVLVAFAKLLESYPVDKLRLCAHNGKEFDYPYLCRRYLINGLKIPSALNIRGKKPWEIQHLDTMEMWSFGDRKNYTSLELLASIFDLPSSKNDIDGSMVNQVYYAENDLGRIARYCQHDVATTARLYLKLAERDDISLDDVEFL